MGNLVASGRAAFCLSFTSHEDPLSGEAGSLSLMIRVSDYCVGLLLRCLRLAHILDTASHGPIYLWCIIGPGAGYENDQKSIEVCLDDGHA